VHPRFGILLTLLFFALPALSQQVQLGHGSSRPGQITQPTDEDETRNKLANEMAKKAAKERVAALKSDTDKLLKLSVELKEYVDKSDANVLSLDVIRKAEAIEKLAKSVKDKMKGPN
jgi:hypothetical protein